MAVSSIERKNNVYYNTPLTSGYLACNSGTNQRIQIGASSPDGHYLAYFGQTRIGLYDVTNSTGIGSIPYNPFQVLSATSASTTLSANTCAVVEYQFDVPEGYTIVSAHDDSYYAGLVASPIRIGTRDSSTGKQKVTFNYLSPNGAAARTYTAKALAVKL